MLDAWMRERIDSPLEKMGRHAVSLGLGANQVTLIGFGFGLAAIPALALEAYGLGLGLIMLNRLADGLDGAVARLTRTSDIGGYLDIVSDFLVYSGVVFGFALARPEVNALAASFLVFSFIGTGTSFLAYAIIAAKRQIVSEDRGRKTFFYLGGLTEGTETIAIMALFCLFPDAFAWLAWGFGALCWVTTVFRILTAVRAFGR